MLTLSKHLEFFNMQLEILHGLAYIKYGLPILQNLSIDMVKMESEFKEPGLFFRDC